MKFLKSFKPIFFFILFCPLLASQCEKPPEDFEEKLPAITTEGKNTFGCRVNGEIWIPWIEFDLFDNHTTVSYHAPTGGVNISTKKKIDDLDLFQAISFSSTDVKGIGEHEYNRADYRDYDTAFCESYRFEHDTILGNKFNILKLDTENHIISGTFEFTAINDECDPVVITDGRFDLGY